MQAGASIEIDLPHEADTARLGRCLAPLLAAGDVLLLEGGLGAGKTHLARALIRHRLRRAKEDVPSPTFTLVQSYVDADGIEIRHADLYRIAHPGEVRELALDDDGVIALVEWPARAGRNAWPDAIRLTLGVNGEGRIARLSAQAHGDFMQRLEGEFARATAADAFLRAAGWEGTEIVPLAGDASARRYARLSGPDGTAVLMDAAPGAADDTAGFVTIAAFLAAAGLSAPQVIHQDGAEGLLLLEDFGDGLFTSLIDSAPEREEPLLAAATDALVHLQRHAMPPGLPDPTADDWAEAAMLAVSVYALAATRVSGDPQPLRTALGDAMRAHADGPRVTILRDFHAGNLIWLPDRTGVARVGLLDFQDARAGQPAYDLVSLLQDARRDVPPAVEAAMIARFVAATGAEPAAFAASYAVLGAQRALRILGVFARLCVEGGKPGYLAHMPRVWDQLQRNLAHPALAGVAPHCATLVPEPTPTILHQIEAQCRTHRAP